jgi:hypothetical protein
VRGGSAECEEWKIEPRETWDRVGREGKTESGAQYGSRAKGNHCDCCNDVLRDTSSWAGLGPVLLRCAISAGLGGTPGESADSRPSLASPLRLDAFRVKSSRTGRIPNKLTPCGNEAGDKA